MGGLVRARVPGAPRACVCACALCAPLIKEGRACALVRPPCCACASAGCAPALRVRLWHDGVMMVLRPEASEQRKWVPATDSEEHPLEEATGDSCACRGCRDQYMRNDAGAEGWEDGLRLELQSRRVRDGRILCLRLRRRQRPLRRSRSAMSIECSRCLLSTERMGGHGGERMGGHHPCIQAEGCTLLTLVILPSSIASCAIHGYGPLASRSKWMRVESTKTLRA